MSTEKEQLVVNPHVIEVKTDEEQKLNPQPPQKYDSTEEQKVDPVSVLDETFKQLGLIGTKTQVVQQTALVVLAVEFASAALVSMILIQLPFLGWLLNFIPLLDWVTIGVYAVTLLSVQFCVGAFQRSPMNVLFLITHFCARGLFFVFLAIWFSGMRLEVYYVFFVVMIFWILFLIKSSDSGELSLQGSFFKTLSVGLIVALFLVMLTRSSFFVILIMPVLGIGYIYVLILSADRLATLDFLTEDLNAVYFGAAQIDADIVMFCQLFIHQLSKKKDMTKEQLKEEIQRVGDEIQQNQDNHIQVANSEHEKIPEPEQKP